MLRPAVNRTNDAADFWRDPFGVLNDLIPSLWGGNAWNNDGLEKKFSNFSTDVIEKDNEYIMQAELPGFNKEDIKIDLKNDVLTISASHSENSDEKDNNGKYIRRERRSSSYQRSFKVNDLKAEDIIAQYRNGVLTVNIPKKEAIPEKEEVTRIEVKD